MLELVGLKSDKGFFFTDNIDNSEYHHSYINNYFYDRKEAKITNKKFWFVIDNEFSKVERFISAKKEIKGYKLKDGFPVSDKTPKKVDIEFFKFIDDDDDGYYKNGEIKGLYEAEYKEIPEYYEDVEFNLKIVGEVKTSKVNHVFSYKILDKWNKEFKITEKDVTYNFINEILYTIPELSQTECELTRKQSYDIIRKYIKDNINSKYAEITSDYNFCLTVKKKLYLIEPEKYVIDVNFNPFSKRKKKSKYETRYRTINKVECYETSPDGYKDYSVVEKFKGKDIKDLHNNIEKFLKELIGYINEPIEYCPHCGGSGIILDNKE